MRRRAGYRKIDTIEVEGTRLNLCCSTENGKFLVEVGDTVLQGKDLEKIRSDAIRLVKDRMKAQYKPVILVWKASWDNEPEKSLGLSYGRYFRALLEDGKSLWKYWEFVDKSNFREREEAGDPSDRVDGAPSEEIFSHTPDDDATVLEYTPAKWLALRAISKAMATINRRVKEVIKPANCEGFLASVARSGAARLLMAPEQDVPSRSEKLPEIDSKRERL